MPEPINTATMPGDDMFPEQIDAAAGKMRTVGTTVSTQGGTVVTSWQKISAHYDAPEENTLFHAMNPVKTEAEKFGTDVGKAATALETFADEVRTIKTAVAAIRADAATFKAGIAGGVEKTVATARGMSTKTETIAWHEDAASVKENNDLIQRTRDQQEALWAAERTCASTIRALVGLSPITAASESNPNGYGLAEIPDGMPTSWGDKVARTENCGERVVHGVANGVGAMGEGFAGMIGFKYTGAGLWDQWDWKWEHSGANAAATWTGIGKFALGAATIGLPGTGYAFLGNGPGSQLLKDSQLTFAAGIAGMLAIDAYNKDPFHKWKKDPAQAFGEAGFNIATIVVAPTKVGNLGKAGTLGRAGEAGSTALRIADPLYWATQAGKTIRSAFGPTVESLLRLDRAADFDTTFNVTKEIELPTVDRTGVDTPNGPGTEAPAPRDYTEPQSRHDSGTSPDQSPAPDRQPSPDREPAVVGGRGDGDSGPSNRSGGDDSGPTGGGRDTDTTPTNRGGDDTPPTSTRDGDTDTTTVPDHPGGDRSDVGQPATEAMPPSDRDPGAEGPNGDGPPSTDRAPADGSHAEPGDHTPTNDPNLTKSDPQVRSQVDQIRADIGPELQKQADQAWQQAIDRAQNDGLAPTPQRLGTYAHKFLADWIDAHAHQLIDPDSGYRIRPESSFDAFGPTESGAKGSIRPDIVIERVNSAGDYEVLHVIDLKTGRAGISNAWEGRVQQWLDPLSPSETLRPAALVGTSP